MSDFVIFCLIVFLVICLILTLVGFVFYTGLLSEVVVRTGSAPVKKITIAYKFRKGSYKASGAAFTESCSIGPKLASVGVFYDDPNQTHSDECRYAVGSILSEDEQKPDEELQRLFEKLGYKIISFPEITCAVTSSFPNRCSLSPVCAAYRVYPELEQYVKERSLNAHPFLEICKGDLIHYMCPLEKQEDFFVPELLEKKTTEDMEETVEHKDDNDTESGAGEELRPESCSVIQKVVEESRDVAEAPLLEGTHHGLTEEEGQSEDGDQGGKGSCESVGSGSSFEELDMEAEEEKKSDPDEPAEEENYNGQQKIIEGGTVENKEE
ncbi:testis-expressed protein 264 homolog [Triplophysa dalaica]|uniref:testis-expressed protein 264 homolog n=1 Tax=Triplophysa dalaica TaxID=1582913 RepID=UPI0024DFCA2A|nr:testis-expressed protein 264 homolog [Triplophysa dalaica]